MFPSNYDRRIQQYVISLEMLVISLWRTAGPVNP